jgi:3-hydroxyacyl-CoA dehydrogenase / 3-hydroxy-2-methylbutyryl-CoA dehydrogenase
MEIPNIVALVTGGASGLGLATAELLAREGARVLAADRACGAEVAADLRERLEFVSADVTSETDVRSAIQHAVERFGRLNVAVNCAGVAAAMLTVDARGPMPLEVFAKVVEINLIGAFNVTRLVAAQMARNEPNQDGERGVVVHTASVAAFDGQAGQAAYAASKAGVVGMTLPIARDFAPLGIRVVTVAPGIFETPMAAAIPERRRLSLVAGACFPRRLGRPREYAMLIRQILENPMLNGETIRLDGALRLPPH